MSSDEGNVIGASDDEIEPITQYQCRRCPGEMFTEAEIDGHRQFHRNARGQRSQSRRQASPAPSEITMFSEILTPLHLKDSAKNDGNRRPKKVPRKPSAPSRPRPRSNKNYNNNTSLLETTHGG